MRKIAIMDIKLPKYNGNTSAKTVNVGEQWLSTWEQNFCLCLIEEDKIKIQQAIDNLLDVVHQQWHKIE